MPVSKIKWNSKANGWGVWEIAESEEQLSNEIIAPDACPDEIENPRKRLEWLASRALLKNMISESGLQYQGIVKDEFGKPFLKDLQHHVSISNSFPFVAVQFHPSQVVGVDIEQPRPKLFTVMRRVLNDREWNDGANNLRKLCIYWCAKEALYKIYGKRSLDFKEQMLVKPFALGNWGILEGTIFSAEGDQTFMLNYEVEKNYILITTKTE